MIKFGLKKKIRPVNRLDRNTSGLVIFAKCEYIQECLSKQMLNKSFKKEYIAIVSGKFANAEKSGTINLPIARKENSIIERCINKDGQKAITHYEVIKQYNKYSLVKCSLETGRTHQIRVHMNYIGHPVVNDPVYGKRKLIDSTGQCLHAKVIGFNHPRTNKYLEFDSELPECFTNILNKFRDS